MTIEFDKGGNVTWRFYRKAYKKARWRRLGQRSLNYVLKNYPGYSGLIIVV